MVFFCHNLLYSEPASPWIDILHIKGFEHDLYLFLMDEIAAKIDSFLEWIDSQELIVSSFEASTKYLDDSFLIHKNSFENISDYVAYV